LDKLQEHNNVQEKPDIINKIKNKIVYENSPITEESESSINNVNTNYQSIKTLSKQEKPRRLSNCEEATNEEHNKKLKYRSSRTTEKDKYKSLDTSRRKVRRHRQYSNTTYNNKENTGLSSITSLTNLSSIRNPSSNKTKNKTLDYLENYEGTNTEEGSFPNRTKLNSKSSKFKSLGSVSLKGRHASYKSVSAVQRNEKNSNLSKYRTFASDVMPRTEINSEVSIAHNLDGRSYYKDSHEDDPTLKTYKSQKYLEIRNMIFQNSERSNSDGNLKELKSKCFDEKAGKFKII
jgi:alanyl-tRNA synthetase